MRTECREAFSKFLEKAGLCGALPRIVACGSRNDAYGRFCTAARQGQKAFLLVDSEGPVDAALSKGPPEGWRPWEYLRRRDGWTQPACSSELDCHLMVQVMESWFLADKEALDRFWVELSLASPTVFVQIRLTSFACTPLQERGESRLSPLSLRFVFMRPGLRSSQACLRHVEDGRRRKRMKVREKCGA